MAGTFPVKVAANVSELSVGGDEAFAAGDNMRAVRDPAARFYGPSAAQLESVEGRFERTWLAVSILIVMPSFCGFTN